MAWRDGLEHRRREREETRRLASDARLRRLRAFDAEAAERCRREQAAVAALILGLRDDLVAQGLGFGSEVARAVLADLGAREIEALVRELESVPGRDGPQHRGPQGVARTLFAIAWAVGSRAEREPVAAWDRAQMRGAR